MKQRTKNILGVVAIVLLSSGVGGFTAYKLVQKARPAAFSELFQQNPDNMHLASYSGAPAQPVDLTEAAEASVHGVVHIKATQLSKTQTVQSMPDFFDFFFGDGNRGGGQRQIQTQPRVGFGSGVIISKDGYIVTNNHVVDGADELSVKLNDGRELKARVIGTDANTDLALIKIQGDDFPTIPVGNSDNLKLGEWVLAVGNPFNLSSTVTAGIVSAKARTIDSASPDGKSANIQSFIQTDAAINQGNSGGALVNVRGELVGINAMLYSPTGAYSGYGFAIPSNIMTKVVSDIKQYGAVQRALLGIKGGTLGTDMQLDDKFNQEMTEKIEKLGAKEGVYVDEVIESGASAGKLKKEDVIIGINGKKIRQFSDLQEALSQFRPGDVVKVKVIRNKKEEEVSITLKNEQGTTKVVKEAGMDILGAAFRPVPDDLKKQLNLGYGLQVTGVSNGKMADAGIRKGFIILKANGTMLKTVDDLNNVMKAAVKSPDQVLFLTGVFSSGKRANYAVDLSQE